MESRKGTDCPIKPITCQEGFCSECQVYRDWRGGKDEKVQICPICGGIHLNYLIHDGAKRYCLDCKCEVIPLVTPQEKRW